jgi:predicted RNA-binding protein YlxR (DUF448 family)
MGHIPERTCIGCRITKPATELVRLVAPNGVLLVIPSRGRSADSVPSSRGRGAWLHPHEACVLAALKTRAFGRAFRRQVDLEQPERLLQRICLAFGLSSHEQGDP